MNGGNVGHSFSLSLSMSTLSLHCPLNYTILCFFLLFDPHMTEHTPLRSPEEMTGVEYRINLQSQVTNE